MSRAIDKAPEPASRRRMKVVIASASRTGTLGLYTAMKILGYKPYHMYECVMGGTGQMKILEEGVLAHHNRFLGIKRYDKEDFEKWLADYDCLIELASYLGTAAIDAYVEDPDVKFILTERDPDKWVASFNNTVGHIIGMIQSFPLNILRYFHSTVYQFCYLNQLMYWSYSDGTGPFTPGNEAALRRNYVEYIRSVKDRIPKDRLCVIRLEDGLGWEQICPFLEVPIPEEEYPRGNEPEKFKKLLDGFFKPKLMTAMLNLTAIVVPIIGAGAWFAVKHGPRLLGRPEI